MSSYQSSFSRGNPGNISDKVRKTNQFVFFGQDFFEFYDFILFWWGSENHPISVRKRKRTT